MSWHIAETRDQAREEAKDGLLIHNNEYTTRALRPDDGQIFKTADEAVDATAFSGVGNAVIGTPDDLIKKIQEMIDVTGGFGAVIGFAHDWANRENTKKSWDLVARYVVPEINSMLVDYRDSIEFVVNVAATFAILSDNITPKSKVSD